MSTPKIQTKILPRKTTSDAEAGYVKDANKKVDDLIDRIENKQKYADRAETLAGSKHWIRHFTIHELVELAPHNTKLWSVDRYFPHAVGGPLVVEEPMMDYQIELCDLKRPLVESLGIRYLVLTYKMDEVQDYEELEKCGQRLQTI